MLYIFSIFWGWLYWLKLICRILWIENGKVLICLVVLMRCLCIKFLLFDSKVFLFSILIVCIWVLVIVVNDCFGIDSLKLFSRIYICCFLCVRFDVIVFIMMYCRLCFFLESWLYLVDMIIGIDIWLLVIFSGLLLMRIVLVLFFIV